MLTVINMSHCKTNIKVTAKLLACIYKCACMLINANFSGYLINSPTSFTMVLFVEFFISCLHDKCTCNYMCILHNSC